MRKARKEELLKFVKSMHQAHEEIREALNRQALTTVQRMLGECQEFAQALGTAIEQTEGEGHVTVSHIEEYCETLFRVFMDVVQESVNTNKEYKTLKKSLLKIENSVKNDICIRKEIAFFPYKAAMWDSLESIYLAAKEDADCDVYCVPVPYYDRNPDRSFGQMHYEGGEYPSNIEIIDWQQYHFEERRPDEIFIHNAYDDWNLVTSVHPRFYSKNLKEHTDKLIYVPYFVLGGINPKNRVAVEKIKHFCFMPGIANADRVIVESEDVRKIYIEEYLVAARAAGLGGRHLEKNYLERKVLGLGSPKYDRVLRSVKERAKIPEEWRKIIWKPDGSRKKVILYNTSIAMLLQHNEKMLQKIQNVLNIFKENNTETALLWRPHPLIKATLEGMRPQLWSKYKDIVRNYVEEGWGIYDDTAEFDRAIEISDAYYGDNSSVVHVYKKTGKSVMLQNVHHLMNTGKYIKKMSFSCIRTVGENTFAFSDSANGIFLLSREGKAEFIASVPKEKMWIKNLYIDMTLWGEYLFLIPGKATAIVRFHTATYEMKRIEMNLIGGGCPNMNKFVGAVLWQHELVLLPEKYPAIVRMNLYEGTLSQILLREPEFWFKKGYYCDGEHVYLPSSTAGFILKYTVTNNKMKKIVIPECGKGVWSLTESNGVKYLVSFPDSNVIWWDEKGNRFGKMLNKIPEYASGGYGSSVIVHCGEKLVVFPIKANYVLEVDEVGTKVGECAIAWRYEQGKTLAYITRDQNLLYFYRFKEEKGLFGDGERELLEINTDTLTIQHREYVVGDMSCILQASAETVFYERYGIELPEFMEFITKYSKHENGAGAEPCGDRIHEELINEKI